MRISLFQCLSYSLRIYGLEKHESMGGTSVVRASDVCCYRIESEEIYDIIYQTFMKWTKADDFAVAQRIPESRFKDEEN